MLHNNDIFSNSSFFIGHSSRMKEHSAQHTFRYNIGPKQT